MVSNNQALFDEFGKLENLVISVWFQISGRYDENVTLDKCVFYYLTDKTPPS